MSLRLDVPRRLRSRLLTRASLFLASSTASSVARVRTHGQRRAPSDATTMRPEGPGQQAPPRRKNAASRIFLRANWSSGRRYRTLDAAHRDMDDGAIVVDVEASAANFPGGCHHAVHVGRLWQHLDSESAGMPQILQNVCLAALRLTCGTVYCWT